MGHAIARFDGLIHFVDWAPTILALAGSAAAAAEFDGVDVWGAISRGSASPRVEMLYQNDQVLGCAALRRGRFKLVRNGDCGAPPALFGSWDDGGVAAAAAAAPVADADAWQLYDLVADPRETTDLAAAQPERVAQRIAEAAVTHSRRAATFLV